MRRWIVVGILAVFWALTCINSCCGMASFDCSKNGVSPTAESDLYFSEDGIVLK